MADELELEVDGGVGAGRKGDLHGQEALWRDLPTQRPHVELGRNAAGHGEVGPQGARVVQQERTPVHALDRLQTEVKQRLGRPAGWRVVVVQQRVLRGLSLSLGLSLRCRGV